jgi:hypothetical protein
MINQTTGKEIQQLCFANIKYYFQGGNGRLEVQKYTKVQK